MAEFRVSRLMVPGAAEDPESWAVIAVYDDLETAEARLRCWYETDDPQELDPAFDRTEWQIEHWGDIGLEVIYQVQDASETLVMWIREVDHGG